MLWSRARFAASGRSTTATSRWTRFDFLVAWWSGRNFARADSCFALPQARPSGVVPDCRSAGPFSQSFVFASGDRAFYVCRHGGISREVGRDFYGARPAHSCKPGIEFSSATDPRALITGFAEPVL